MYHAGCVNGATSVYHAGCVNGGGQILPQCIMQGVSMVVGRSYLSVSCRVCQWWWADPTSVYHAGCVNGGGQILPRDEKSLKELYAQAEAIYSSVRLVYCVLVYIYSVWCLLTF